MNRAAAQIGIPQPALSRQVRRLEEYLGGSLFDRDTHGVRLTALGSMVLDYANLIIDVVEDLEQDLTTHRLNLDTTLRVGWSTSSLSALLLHCLRELDPAQHMQITTSPATTQLVESLRSGHLDLVLLAEFGQPASSGHDAIGYIPIVDEPLLLAMPSGHPLVAEDQLSMAQLANEDWIISSGRDGCREAHRQLCQQFGFLPKITHDVPVTGPREDVIITQGSVTFVQASRPTRPGIALRPVVDLPISTRHLLAYRRDSAVAAKVPRLAALLTDSYWHHPPDRPTRNVPREPRDTDAPRRVPHAIP